MRQTCYYITKHEQTYRMENTTDTNNTTQGSISRSQWNAKRMRCSNSSFVQRILGKILLTKMCISHKYILQCIAEACMKI